MTKNTTYGMSGLKVLDFHAEQQEDRKAKADQVVTDNFPDYRDIDQPFRWGTYSWLLRKSHVRLVRKSTALSLGAGMCTPTDVVCDYLDLLYPNSLRAAGSQAVSIKSHKSAPLYGRYGAMDDGSYVDISAAYYDITRICGWNVDYYPGNWLCPGHSTSDFPLPKHKSARSALVSMGISRHAILWTGKQFKQVPSGNRHINFGLWTIVQDVLHSIAQVAVQLGAIYVHTDGYILPSSSSDKLREEISSWGLQSNVKSRGQTLVFGIGNYSVGEKKTRRFRAKAIGPVTYLREIPSEWLHKQWDELLRRQVDTSHM